MSEISGEVMRLRAVLSDVSGVRHPRMKIILGAKEFDTVASKLSGLLIPRSDGAHEGLATIFEREDSESAVLELQHTKLHPASSD